MTAVRDAAPTVTLVHAVLPALEVMEAALVAEMPDVRVRHLLDEGLSSEAERRGGVDRVCVERMLTILELAVAARTDAIMLTCTAYSTMLPEARRRFPETPLYAVDQVMVERAVEQASRIGVLATFAAGLEQQREMLAREAAAQGKTIEIVPSLHPAAMQALRRGDAREHDRIVLAALPALAAATDLVLLAQASMARVYDQIPPESRDRVLSSPRLAAAALRKALRAGAAAT
jgi:glutamate racemase